MDRESIERALAAVVPKAANIFREIDTARAQGRFADTIPHISELAKPIGDLLSVQPEFSQLDQMMIDFGGVRLPFDPRYFATRFLRFACERGTDGALDWVAKVLGTKEAAALCVRHVYGLKVEKNVWFGDGRVRLIAFEHLPASDHKTAEKAKGISWVDGPYPTEMPASAALVSDVMVRPFFSSSAASAKAESVLLDGLTGLENIASALAVAVGKPVLPGDGWAEYVDRDLEAVRSGRGSMTAREDVRSRFVFDHPFDASSVKAHIEAYIDLPRPAYDIVTIASKRFNQAMRRLSPADKVIDAGVGLEALLGDSEDHGEIIERLSRRAALLIGGDLEQKKGTKNAIKKFYRMRSAAVHTGRLPARKKTDEIISEGLSLGLDIIRKVTALGDLPPWEQWELAGP